MFILIVVLCLVTNACSSTEDGPWDVHGELRVNGRFLVYADGTPFFYLGDTNWEFLMCARREDAVKLIENRHQKGFTVMQTVITGAYLKNETISPKPNVYGDYPFIGLDVTRPKTTPGLDPNDSIQYDFWDHIDYIVSVAESKEIYIGMLLGWDGLYKEEVINVGNARDYGRWIGRRYRDSPNVIWILGGDTRANTESAKAVFDEIASGLNEGDEGRHLMTFHSVGGTSSGNWLSNKSWLDFNMLQTGHSAYDIPNYNRISKDYVRTPVKPCMDGESRYEDHSVNWNPDNGWFNDFDIRQGAYWSLFAGACGHTYGTRGVWQMYEPGRPKRGPLNYHWYDAMDLPGGHDMKHVKDIMLSRPMLSRIPDQSLIEDAYSDAGHIQATRGDGYAFVYIPTGKTININLIKIMAKKTIHAWWYNPRDGLCYDTDGSTITDSPFATFQLPFGSSVQFVPPGFPKRGNDWVLVLDDASKDYPPPGTVQ